MRTELTKRERNLHEAIREILDNLKAIKGEKYSNAISTVFNVANIITVIMCLVPKEAKRERVCMLVDKLMDDTTDRLASLITDSNELRVIEAIAEDIHKDVMLLIRKQDEFQGEEE